MFCKIERVSGILEVLNRAIEDSKSVDQVSNLTNDILNISSQTNLLALNASIEAANRIQEINNVVTHAVHNLSDNANNLIGYLQESILPEFEFFVEGGAPSIDEGARGVNGAAESTQVLVEDIVKINGRMDINQKIAGALQDGTDIFEKF